MGAGLALEERVVPAEGMDCPSCASTATKTLLGLGGVSSVRPDIIAQRVLVRFDPTRVGIGEITHSLRSLGYGSPEAGVAPSSEAPAGGSAVRDAGATAGMRRLVEGAPRHVVLGGVLWALTIWATLGDWNGALTALLGAGTVLAAGWRVLRPAVTALLHGALDMHVLMVAAAVGALFIGEYVEAGAVLFLFAVARELEQRALGRARVEVRSLMDLTAPDATVLRHGHDVRVPVEAVRPGELVLVRPGERIPVDGTVVNGSSEVDVSAITGEPVPEGKFNGDQVLAGSLNGRGALEIVCDRPAAESAIGRILASLEAARVEKSRAEAFVDRFAKIYTPVVMAAAVLVAVVPPLFFGGVWGDWGYRALVLLVVACPCALVISTPVTVVSALTGAARRGILVKNGVHLEVLGEVRTVAIDKTGTLTEGTPLVTDVVSWDGTAPNEILELAATAESRSEHPVARAILEAAREGDLRLPVGVDMHALPGRGARARVGGREVLLGSPRLFREEGLLDETGVARVARAEAAGSTVVLVAWDDPPSPLAIRGSVLLADRLREGVPDLIRGLRENGVRRVVCMSGDRSSSVDAALAGLGPTDGGFDEWRGDLLPDEKVDWVRHLRRDGPVLMIGDGVNDAPALAAADTGMAMGLGGTGLALDAADIALMHDDVRRIPEAFRIGRKASRIIRANIAFAIAVKLGFVALGGVGVASLWMAVLADMGSSLAVIGNGLRALKAGPPDA